MEKVLQFLTDLSENNNREWYHANKGRYQESREKVLFLTDVLINEIRKFDREVPPLAPKDCVFRIFRDVRFSKDKRPYKTNFGAFISKGGRKSINAGYYFHIQPGGSFVGGGLYMPEAVQLRAARDFLAEHGTEFLEITKDPDFMAIYPHMLGDKLKTSPKGFDKEHEFIELLRYKSFVFSRPISDREVLHNDFIEKLVDSFKKLHPVNALLNEALQNN